MTRAKYPIAVNWSEANGAFVAEVLGLLDCTAHSEQLLAMAR